MLADRTARRMAAALSAAIGVQLEREALDPRERIFAALDAEDRRRLAERLGAVEGELLVAYRADRRTVQLARELAARLREPERLLLAGLACALAPGRLRDELIRADVAGAAGAEATPPAELVRDLRRRVPVDELLGAMLRALRGHDDAIAAVHRTLAQLAAATVAIVDVDEPAAEVPRDEPAREPDPYEGGPAGDPFRALPRRGGAFDPFGAVDASDPYAGGEPWE